MMHLSVEFYTTFEEQLFPCIDLIDLGILHFTTGNHKETFHDIVFCMDLTFPDSSYTIIWLNLWEGAGGHILWLGEVQRSSPCFVNLSCA